MPSLKTILLLPLLLLGTGCATHDPPGDKMILLVPGVAGNIGYDGLERGLADGGVSQPVVTVSWGAPLPLFVLNFSGDSIHADAEGKLAARIGAWAANHPDGQIDLIGHSAGCGVILGALARMPADLHVRNVVLLAPSVSPGYELGPSAGHVEGTIWVFYSPHDKLFLSWRTGNFGTYDGIKTPAAGNRGFDPAMVEALHGKVVQHAYDPAWAQLGNDGDHGGWLAKAFATTVLAALLQ